MKETLRAIGLMAGRFQQADIRYSQYTNEFYVESPLEITDLTIVSGFTEHRDSPEEAVAAYWRRLQTVEYGGKEFIRIQRGGTILGAQYDDISNSFIYYTLEEMRALTKD